MQIKNRNNSSAFRLETGQTQVRWRRILGALAIVLLVALGLYAIALASLPAAPGAPRDVPAIAEQLRARLTSHPVRLVLDIKQKHLQRIRFSREKALEERINLPGPDDFVPAQMRFEGETLDLKVRLKGVYVHNWRDPRKWSLLMKVRSDHTFLGMKRFAIQHPEAGSFLFEWLFDKALEDEGMLAQRYHFVDVVINGDEFGIHALHEHFGKRLVEHGHRREGPIIGYNKDVLLEEYQRARKQGLRAYNVDGAFWSAYVDGVQTGRLVPGSSQEELYIKAQSLLESFRLGLLPAADVFDLESMAKGMALKALFGAQEFDWKDLKLYYNPILGVLEPIIAEIHYQPSLPVPGWWLNDGDRPYMESFTGKLFADQEFFELYLRELDRVSKPDYLHQLIARHAEGLEKNIGILHREDPGYVFSPGSLVKLQEQIRALLEPLRGLHAYYSHAEEGKAILQLGSVQHFPVEVLHLSTADGQILAPTQRTVVPGKGALDPVSYQLAAFEVPTGTDWVAESRKGLTASFRVLGLEKEYSAEVFPWPYLREDLVFGDPFRRESDFRQKPFLMVDEESKEIRFLPGRWDLDETLVLPAGYLVEGGANLQVNLKQGASIVSHSPLRLVGEEDSPILIESQDGTGGGLAVIATEGRSYLANVILRNLSAPTEGGWALTGAVTFYEADVDFDSCIFAKNLAGDDLVNLVRSEFQIENSQFSDSLADALDADFCRGTVLRSHFENAGNDAVDTSGSRIRLRSVSVEGAGDKALSFGEESTVEGFQIQVFNSRIGVASKDRSTVQLRQVRVSDTEIGLTAYTKKPEFGPGSLWLERYLSKNVATPHLLEDGSTISVDRRPVAVNSANIAQALEVEQ